ncbi:hypothetical protein I302_105181 [Kwoniella bestiolae CBS 10118]|uniref:Uncharacterized protein n=1 Tax=Kwoniella bestiolae CBS 10118 TaxID=1296100 RepID=A0A1B9FSE6_9TREE|nr:hypothetical protein I302_08468 [Kwoniella bestiolae CBS 10118]OCF21691.1 hypothetical protein I302_08468 [Kwoniella bestiolae CBS 10118]
MSIPAPNISTPATLGRTLATGANLIPLGRPIRPLSGAIQRGYQRPSQSSHPPMALLLPHSRTVPLNLPHFRATPLIRNPIVVPRKPPPPPLSILPARPPHLTLTHAGTSNKSKRYPPYLHGKVALTREQVLANEKTAQVRAAIKRGMTLMSYRIFRAVGPVTIDPTVDLEMGPRVPSPSLDLWVSLESEEELISLRKEEGQEDLGWMDDTPPDLVVGIRPIFHSDSGRHQTSTDRSELLRNDARLCLLD